jgi:hypothetical protein
MSKEMERIPGISSKTRMATNLNLKDLLRITLNGVERSTQLSDDDPALMELKNSLVRSVAELDIRREQPQIEENRTVGGTVVHTSR